MLQNWIGCKSNELLQNLIAMFGSDITDGGRKEDHDDDRARYLDSMERKLYRLHFKSGIAYQYPWWKAMRGGPAALGQTSAPMLRLCLAESVHAYQPEIKRLGEAPSEGFGAFVCTMEREFFMYRHRRGDMKGQNGIYHSAYTSGSPVMFAGSMLIERGIVRAIRDDSGHYQPEKANMAAVLQALRMYGVNVSNVSLVGWEKARPLGTGQKFLTSHLSWNQFRKRGVEQLQSHKEAHPTIKATIYD
jgi:hypothetical protein